MKIALLTSNHIRHKYMASELSLCHDLKIVVSEDKGNEKQKNGDTEMDTAFLKSHFNMVKKSEIKILGEVLDFPDTRVLSVSRGDINSKQTAEEVKKYNLDAIVVFGCGILKTNIINICPDRIFNVHQGLSPYYRGSGTNFHPFVNGEIEFVGATIHYINEGIDTGDIVSHVRPEIAVNDTMYEIGCKAIKTSVKEIINVLNVVERGTVLHGIKQWDKGKIYYRKDFNIESLNKAIKNVGEGMISNYVDKMKSGFNFGVRTVKLC